MLVLEYIAILAFLTSAWGGKTCDTHSLLFNARPCSSTETCIPKTINAEVGSCECLPGFTRVNDTFCFNATVDNDATPRSSSLTKQEENGEHVVVGILLPMFLIMVVISGIYFGRKYNMIDYVRSKLHNRNNNYDEVMIGQELDEDDDPPLR